LFWNSDNFPFTITAHFGVEVNIATHLRSPLVNELKFSVSQNMTRNDFEPTPVLQSNLIIVVIAFFAKRLQFLQPDFFEKGQLIFQIEMRIVFNFDDF